MKGCGCGPALLLSFGGAALIVFLLMRCGGGSTPPSGAPLLIGYVGTVTRAGDGTFCFDSSDSLNEAIKAMVANDQTGYEQIALAHGTPLHAGDRVRGIALGGITSVEMRIETGRSAGVAYWMPIDLNILKNVHDAAP